MASDPRFETLAHVVEIANTSVDIRERLESILGALIAALSAEKAVLLQQEEHARSSLVAGIFWPRDAAAEVPAVSVGYGEALVGDVARRREPLIMPMEKTGQDAALDAYCPVGRVAGLFPVQDDNRLYAVLLLTFPSGRELTSDEMRLMQMISREMAGTIRNHRLYFEAKKRIAELNIISEMGRAAVATIEVDDMLQNVAGMCAKLLGTKGGLVCINGENGDRRTMARAHFGQVPDGCLADRSCHEACALYESYMDGQAAAGDKLGGGLCVPLSFKGSFTGHLCVFGKVPREKGGQTNFNSDDANLLGTMASMISAALENALTYQRMEDLAQRNEEMVHSLGTIYEISRVLMTTVDFEETVLILLHAVTHPVGLDHDRVMLFVVDEGVRVLRPVAELTRPYSAGNLRELTATLLGLRNQDSKTNLEVSPDLAQLSVGLDPKSNILAATMAGRQAITVDDPEIDPRVSGELLDVLGPHAFVAVPMFAKNNVAGVLVVNNSQSKRPFSEREVKLLVMLANLGGLALETSRLYQHLEQANSELAHMRNRLLEADKLAALGEVAAGVAHEIRNPLVSIGGFTRRIRKKVGDDSPITPYLDVIIEEAARLERTLNEMLDFSTDARNHMEEHDLNLMMDQAVELLSRDMQTSHVEVVRNFTPNLPKVYCDDRQIKHVFLNLYLNAIQAIGPEGGRITLRSYTVIREGKQFVAGEVTDTGGGISMEVIHNIFNPFFTTKDTGSGLGLSIVHKIVTRHFGQVEVHNREGEGASFLVTLPAAEEGRAYLK